MLLHHMNAPVAESRAREAVATERQTRRVLVPLEVPARDLRALSFALGSAGRNTTSLFLLHVVDFGPSSAGVIDSPLIHSPEYCEKVAQRYLRRLAKREIPADVPIQILVRHGKTEREIVRVAKEICSDSIVLSARRKNWLSRWFAGDTAGWVEAHAPCSVIVLRDANYGACPCFSDGPRPYSATVPSAV